MNPDPSVEIRSLSSGIRAVSVVFILILSYFNIRTALLINYFARIYSDMLDSAPLPTSTNIVVQNNTPLILLALFIPVAAIAIVIRMRNHKYALYSLAALMGLVFIQLYLTVSSLFLPLMTIINKMQGS